jgi:hypothetical protein
VRAAGMATVAVDTGSYGMLHVQYQTAVADRLHPGACLHSCYTKAGIQTLHPAMCTEFIQAISLLQCCATPCCDCLHVMCVLCTGVSHGALQRQLAQPAEHAATVQVHCVPAHLHTELLATS